MPQSNPESDPRAWDRVASIYDEAMSPFTMAFATDALALARLDGSSTVLDVATGTGALALLAARSCKRVAAIDFAPAMIERLRFRLVRERIGNIDSEVMDARSLAFGDGEFDVVFALFALPAIPDRPAALAEMQRVLRPDGSIIVSTWSAPDRCPFMRVPVAAFRAALGEPAGNAPGLRALDTPATLAAELEGAGFRDVSVRSVVHPRTAPDAATYWEQFAGTTAPVAAVRARVGVDRWAGISATVIASLREQLGDGPISLDGEALIARGTR